MSSDTIPTRSDGAVIDQTWFNILQTVLGTDFTPRTAGGVATDKYGSLGTASYRWLHAHVTDIYLYSTNTKKITYTAPASLAADYSMTLPGALPASTVPLQISSSGVMTFGQLPSGGIADDAVITAKILDANVTTAKIADSNVTTVKIADSNVTTPKIANANVTTAKIADLNVTTGKLADLAVTTDKINNSDVTLSKLAAEVLAFLVPTGCIMAYTGATAPTGWLICDGTSYLIASYSALYAVIGDSNGAADGLHFNVPDLRGRFLRGWDHAQGRDPDASSRTASNSGGNTGDNIGTLQSYASVAHNHTATVTESAHTHTISVTNPPHTHSTNPTNIYYRSGSPGSGQIDHNANYGPGDTSSSSIVQSATTTVSATAGSTSTGLTVANTATTGNETRPVNVTVQYIIKI